MSFVGEVNRLGDSYVRPHDIEVVLDPDENTEEAMVQRIVALGFEIRVEFVLGDGTEVWAQLTRGGAAAAGAARGADRLPAPGPRKKLQRFATAQPPWGLDSPGRAGRRRCGVSAAA